MRATRAVRTAAGAIALLGSAALGACGPRQVEVRTTPAASSRAEAAVVITNRLARAVNVYVSTGGSDMFLRQVAANSTTRVPVPGVAAGTTVTLRASVIDGSARYERRDVTLSGALEWIIP